MASLFEEQVRAEDTAYALYTDRGSYSQSEAGSYFPHLPDYDRGVSDIWRPCAGPSNRSGFR